MKKRLRFLALTLVALMLLTVGGAAATEGKDLVIQLGPNPETIDPALNSAVDGANYLYFLFEGLLANAEDGTVQPGMAESYTVSEDCMTYTFTLRPGLTWSDGSPLTANDFVYSWQRVADALTAAPWRHCRRRKLSIWSLSRLQST